MIRMIEHPDVAVVGGGVVGLSVAGTLSRHFRDVTVFERGSFYREASYAAGGMLAPLMEAQYQESEKLRLCRESLRRYPEFLGRIGDSSNGWEGRPGTGTLMVARHPEHEADLERLYGLQKRWELPVERLTGKEARRRVPCLDRNLRMGLYAPDERFLNNRRLGLALYRWCQRRGVNLRGHEPVESIHHGRGGRVVRLETPYRSVAPDEVVIAAGAWSGDLEGLKPEDSMPVRPVKGQALSVQMPPEELDYVLRSPDVYLVPHPSERLLIGATMEEKGFSPGNTAGKVLDLLQYAREIVPGVAECPMLQTWWGFRPVSRDDRPVLGPSPVTPNLTFATGHGRHGILLAAVTADWIRHWMVERTLPEGMKPFLPQRFADARAPSGRE